MTDAVKCHSGHEYAQRPVTFFWDDVEFAIEAIQAEWRSPVGKHFRVLTKNRSVFELIYDQAKDGWQIREI